MTALDFMQELVDKGVRESAGKNRSPVIDTINREMGLPLGSPYCAAAISHCFRKASERSTPSLSTPSTSLPQVGEKLLAAFPYSGSSQSIRRSFKTMGRLSKDPQSLLSWRGALGGWTNADDPAHGHVFLIKGRLTNSAGEVVGLVTLEANTSLQTQDRDGEGFFELHRSIDNLRTRHPLFWFLRTDGIVGGEWWATR